MDEIIEAIKVQLPENSIRISHILQELLEEIELIVEHFISEGYLPENLDHIYGRISHIKEEMSLGFGQLNLLEINIEEEIKDDIKAAQDDYRVDSKIPHSLLENFTYIKPLGFKFLDEELVQARSWKALYIKACELFVELDEELFRSFENKTNMNGQRINYFAKTKEEIEIPIKLRDKIYINTDFNANQFRDLLIKILKEYGFDAMEFKVFFRADYNPKHGQKDYIDRIGELEN
nr:hypothetical protein [Tissierella sp.]